MKQMKKKILVVEDNLLLSGILRKWLKQADYEVLTAEIGIRDRCCVLAGHCNLHSKHS